MSRGNASHLHTCIYTYPLFHGLGVAQDHEVGRRGSAGSPQSQLHGIVRPQVAIHDPLFAARQDDALHGLAPMRLGCGVVGYGEYHLLEKIMAKKRKVQRRRGKVKKQGQQKHKASEKWPVDEIEGDI